jgi:DNA invertase Pin-like site-specific DNA recombinase
MNSRGSVGLRRGLAEFERELIRARTGEGRARAKARGVKLGRRPKLTASKMRSVSSPRQWRTRDRNRAQLQRQPQYDLTADRLTR